MDTKCGNKIGIEWAFVSPYYDGWFDEKGSQKQRQKAHSDVVQPVLHYYGFWRRKYTAQSLGGGTHFVVFKFNKIYLLRPRWFAAVVDFDALIRY